MPKLIWPEELRGKLQYYILLGQELENYFRVASDYSITINSDILMF